ncbi:MAG: pyridoxal-phosphate dependent enzyme [Alphaproteobacteria bacterium]
MPVPPSILELIGNTPMLELTRSDTGPCRLFVKLENQNPGGSIKDRIALTMIEVAENEGRIKPGDMLIEATAGNTGLGLALVAAQKGYRLTIVMPDKMAQEKVFHLKALGAQVISTRSDVERGHPAYYQDMAERLARETPGSYWINQFANPANPLAHETTTGPEIWEQMDHQVDAVVCGVGSGGTLTGLGRFFAKVAPETEMIVADPRGSIIADMINTGRATEPVGSWVVEGIGEDFVPPNCDLSLARRGITIGDGEALDTARILLRDEGVLAGSSSGTLIAAALHYCREQHVAKRVVTFVCDSGNKYLNKMFNDYWMADQGFLVRERHGDLRDIIARPASDDGIVSVDPSDSLLTAYSRMRRADVSQVPVLSGGRLVGILDESDILAAAYGNRAAFKAMVDTAMSSRLKTLPPSAPIDALLPVFRDGEVAVIQDGDTFCGLITKIDLINHLRRSMDT